MQLAKVGLNVFGAGLKGQNDPLTTTKITSNPGEMRWALGIGLLFGAISSYKIPISRMESEYNKFMNSMTSAWMSGVTLH
ncbi:hypothetical protein [Pedobacter sp. JY14-1]|uniref:hypothetical protein n=1 Tax=Pedobacter sp. JY14-1 TaxID=3034151 RepID=UPI0023E1E905|nr:hypothetical protein [Pedobacter sp. JY14-1]